MFSNCKSRVWRVSNMTNLDLVIFLHTKVKHIFFFGRIQPSQTADQAIFNLTKEMYSVERLECFIYLVFKLQRSFVGVRIIPELDTPAHVGYGWQFPGSEGYTVCVGQEPWFGFCQQPPCGQVKPFYSNP